MKPPRLFVFDWDGTLIDSVGRIVACLGHAADASGLARHTRDAYAEVIGLGLPQAVSRLYPDLDTAGAEAYRLAYATAFVAVDATPSPLFPGARETLQALRERGHRLAVATGKSRRGLDRVLAAHGLDGFFDATRCADETASKPDPRMLLEILAELGAAPCDAVVVGDTEYDLEMASRAGVTSIGVAWGVHAPERLRRHRPERIVSSLPELLC